MLSHFSSLFVLNNCSLCYLQDFVSQYSTIEIGCLGHRLSDPTNSNSIVCSNLYRTVYCIMLLIRPSFALNKSFWHMIVLMNTACKYLICFVLACLLICTAVRHEAIMLQKLSIMLLSSAQKTTYYAFENYPLFPKLCHHNWLIMPVYCCIIPFSLIFKL